MTDLRTANKTARHRCFVSKSFVMPDHDDEFQLRPDVSALVFRNARMRERRDDSELNCVTQMQREC
jgi:hypothetical protein